MSPLPYRLACFDVDGTLVGKTVFVWETLHERLGTDPAARQRGWEDYFSGRIPYSAWFEHDIELFRGRGGETRERLLDAMQGLELVEGVHEVLGALRDAGLRLAVVSGSLNLVLEKFELDQYFDDVFINELFFDRAGALLGWRPTPFDIERKAGALDWLLAKYDLEPSQTVFVGDNFNDVSIAKRAGKAIAFNSTCDELIQCAAVNVPGTDLRDVLPHILGRPVEGCA
ncbi:MAG: HAD-IB family phosphatase [Deltaproteobacteria bacterium]|nr:HAD-IB family phosphatase [Deltaproteobacteria bacterium]MBW2534549.1 HAD-IB family phosphatase [Deltaproteobacteria bacterium]